MPTNSIRTITNNTKQDQNKQRTFPFICFVRSARAPPVKVSEVLSIGSFQYLSKYGGGNLSFRFTELNFLGKRFALELLEVLFCLL